MENDIDEVDKKNIVSFKCKECGESIEIGEGGFHREKHNHKEFLPIYEDKK